ncbi:MAG: hypothetical protein ACR2LX_02900 [Jatrophihabitans sp.]
MSTGRPAALPSADYQAPTRLVIDDQTCRVHFISESYGEQADYDFTALPVTRELQRAFARAFAEHTGPAGRVKSLGGATRCWIYLRKFCNTLAEQAPSPRTAGELRPSHMDQFLIRHADTPSTAAALGVIRSLLVRVEGLSAPMLAKCAMWIPESRDRTRSRASYSPSEEKKILDAARATVRAAANRIRSSRELLDRWRDGDTSLTDDSIRSSYCRLLDLIDTMGDVPRYPGNGQPLRWTRRHGTVPDLTLALNLNWHEASALTILLVRLTGQNGSTIARASAAYHRPDGESGSIPNVQIDLDKPRRGQRRYMTATLADVPRWAAAPDEGGTLSRRSELHTAFGVYMLAVELTTSARQVTGRRELLQYWGCKAGGGVGRGFRVVNGDLVSAWGQSLGLTRDPDDPDAVSTRLRVGVGQMRVTYLAREQRPVAHTEQTLASTYLRRDPASVAEYQHLVADVLGREVAKAHTLGRIAQLSPADVSEATRDPAGVAARFNISENALAALLTGAGDTVLAGCSDNHNSPHSQPGRPCRASFLKCLDCPCARALPHHLPLQVLARDLIADRRAQMSALRWAERFAVPFTQLEDLLAQVSDNDVEAARRDATRSQRDLVIRLLSGELDHT